MYNVYNDCITIFMTDIVVLIGNKNDDADDDDDDDDECSQRP